MLPTPVERLLVARASTTASADINTGSTTGNQFLSLLASPFSNNLSTKAILSSVIFSISLSILLIIAFSLIRPYHTVVYAPRAKYADSKHAPPAVRQGLFGWARTIMGVREPELVEKLGLDAALFMRFVRMMRNILSVLTIVGCGLLIPTNLLRTSSSASFLLRLTPIYYAGGASYWVYVLAAYAFDVVICFFLWRNYAAVLRLRRQYFESDDYQRGLHSRTLMVTEIPRDLRSDEGIVRITEQVQASGDVPRAAISRNVRDLPELVEEHEESVRQLESVLAKYLKNPNKLPDKRPTCKVSKNDKGYSRGQRVDAIEYLTARIKELELEIREVRESADMRNPMSYGFASYASIMDAHTVAYAARKKGPQGTKIRQAPKPNDLIWKNLALAKKQRDWKNFINNLWVALLTVVYIVPNVCIAVFLTNLSHIGLVWPAFQRSLEANPTVWSLVQGILAPALTTLIFIFLPKLFRRLVTSAGDETRTMRERHVMHKLFSFFLFNNVIVFSLFSSVWGFVATIVKASNAYGSVWDAIKASHPFKQLVSTLILTTDYWLVWLLQRNLSTAVDLSQLVTLIWGSFQRRFMAPTPRELIELSAPQPFDYAPYYNYFLFYFVVTLSFGCLQPLMFPVIALYFWMDSFFKKYLLLYIFITKYESGGMFWRSLYNRLLVCTFLGNIVIALVVGAQGANYVMLAVMAPLPFLLIGFKFYCMRAFDDGIEFYNKGSVTDPERVSGGAGGEHKRRKGDRVGVRFGNPLLYRPLLTPMVAAKSQHLLKQVYTGRTSFDDSRTVAGYSDVYMEHMDGTQPGKPAAAGTDAPFAFVPDNQLDYEHWKNDANFAHEGGGDGQLYGQSADLTRPGTPGSMMTATTTPGGRVTPSRDSLYSRPGSAAGFPIYPTSVPHSRGPSDGGDLAVGGADENYEYPRGYHVAASALREQSPAGRSDYSASASAGRHFRDQSRENLVAAAAQMGRSGPPQQQRYDAPTPGTMSGPSGGGGVVGPGPGGYGYSLPGTPGDGDEVEGGSYDYFRRGRGAR